MFEAFLNNYEGILHAIAEVAAVTLELIGILIIVFGSGKSLVLLIRRLLHRCNNNIIVALGKTLGFALEFLMGAEIIKTVITVDLTKLASLGVIVIIRVVLAIILHWEIKTEEQEEKAEFAEQENNE